ncbi:hypothetical protein BLNAU_13746 [Blattamonas nauphoetae]|uniref:Secreted protein n=1 Tax=Blattamonas nauphoetae TaxID=2049346 RepID=A0ABQ9XHS4_9EUKA|nr:hypothetical protein BLNAU_13746 [Blattamonas nauphoetae]
MNRSSYYLFRFCNDLFLFLLHLWTICVSASKLATDLDWNQVFRPHLLLSSIQRIPAFHLFQLAAHCHPSLPLLPFSTLLQRRLANEVCGAGEVDLCVLTLSSLTNTHVAVTQSNQESGEGSWCVVDQKATRDKEERKCV